MRALPLSFWRAPLRSQFFQKAARCNFQGSQEGVARLPTQLAHPLQDESAVVNHVIGPSLQGQRQNCGELGRLLPVDIPGRGSVVVTTRRLRTINTKSPFDHVEVELQYAPLAEDQFGHRDKRGLGALAEDRPPRSEEQVFYQLLRKGGPPANAAAFDIVFSSNLHRVPIESMMLVEARVFRGDDSMLEIGRDLAQGNEFVSFVIWHVVNPGLHAALHANCGGRWVDPPGGHKDQHSKQPKKRHSEDKPSKEGSEKASPKRGFVVCVWIFSHILE
jgi:hypothetical protein